MAQVKPTAFPHPLTNPIAWITLFLFLLGLAALAHGAEITWTGCGITQKAFMAEIAKAYEAKTGTPIKLSGGGATKGIRAVSAGSSDLGGTCRHALAGNPEEVNAELVQVAWDAIIFVVHPSNPIENITLADMKKVYDGEITSWKELGGPDAKIALVTRDESTSGVGYMLRSLVFNDPNYEFKARSLKVKDSGPLEEKVEQTPMALGADGISSAHKRQVKVISLDGVAPTKENIASAKYPLFRPLYVTINKNGSPEIRKVVDFMLSPEGQAIISAEGTVNLEEGKDLAPLWAAKNVK